MIRCLIVDDIKEIRCMLEAFLWQNGYEIMTACDGAEALEKARANPPDIIISDLFMPVMDGFALCKEWKKDERLKDIPFVVFTATYTEAKDEEFALSLGVDRFILKPLKMEILMNILNEVLNERYTVKPLAAKPLGEEMEFFRRHDEILFKKLEKKMSDLEIANQKLRISEEELRLHGEILAHMMESVHLVRAADGVIVYTNKRFESVFGYDPGELIGKHVSILNAPDEKSPDAVASEIIRSLKQSGGAWSGEVHNIRKDGHSFWCFANVSTFKHPQYGEVWISVNQDITERKQAESQREAVLEELQTSENKYRYLVENINDAIFTLNKEGRFTYISPVIERILGYSPEALIGHPFRELIYPEDLPLVITAFNNVQSGILKHNEYRILNKSGKIQWIRSSSRPNYSNGNVDGIIGIAVDITEQKRAEEELRNSRSQLRALATRLQQIREEERAMMAREIHDEMGGGLTGLKMDISWLLRKMGAADRGDERANLMDKIHAANALIDQMIRVVRRISTDLRPSILDDLGLVAAIEWQLSEFTSRNEIPHEFTTTCEYINMEKDTAIAVFRIFQEALTNVVRHSRATKVDVVLRESERSLFGDESLVLEIRDNGKGITEEEIMNPESFGLLGMKERVLAFGGELSILGEPGGGTALILKIPLTLIQGEPS